MQARYAVIKAKETPCVLPRAMPAKSSRNSFQRWSCCILTTARFRSGRVEYVQSFNNDYPPESDRRKQIRRTKGVRLSANASSVLYRQRFLACGTRVPQFWRGRRRRKLRVETFL